MITPEYCVTRITWQAATLSTIITVSGIQPLPLDKIPRDQALALSGGVIKPLLLHSLLTLSYSVLRTVLCALLFSYSVRNGYPPGPRSDALSQRIGVLPLTTIRIIISMILKPKSVFKRQLQNILELTLLYTVLRI